MYLQSHGARGLNKRGAISGGNLSTEIPINLKCIDKSHMLRLMCHIPFHHIQIPSHLCALATQCLRLPSITIAFLKEQYERRIKKLTMGTIPALDT